MLPKHRRLDKKTFNIVYDEGKNISSKIGYFKVRKKTGKTRIACIASKKAAKKSTDRTRIRRRGYEAVGAYLDKIPDDFDIIWFLPAEVIDMEFSVLKKSVERMIESLNDV